MGEPTHKSAVYKTANRRLNRTPSPCYSKRLSRNGDTLVSQLSPLNDFAEPAGGGNMGAFAPNGPFIGGGSAFFSAAAAMRDDKDESSGPVDLSGRSGEANYDVTFPPMT